ncbi:MAG: hypothetical protein ACM34I_04855 [bacterium]
MKKIVMLVALFVSFMLVASVSFAAEKSSVFKGVKVNGGTVMHSKEGGKHVLTLSDDFQNKIDTPDPHWQVVDSKGNTYLLDRFEVKDMKMHRKITVPDYVKDISKVQFWCSFAETLLGEASFGKPMK